MDGSLKRSRPTDDEDYSAQDAKKTRCSLTDEISNPELLEVLAERVAGDARLRADVLSLLGADEGTQHKNAESMNGHWEGSTAPGYFAPSLAASANGGGNAEGSDSEHSSEMSPLPLSPIFSPEFWDRVAAGAHYASSPSHEPTFASTDLATTALNAEQNSAHDGAQSPSWMPTSPTSHMMASPSTTPNALRDSTIGITSSDVPFSPTYIPQSPTYSPQSPAYSPQSSILQPENQTSEEVSSHDWFLSRQDSEQESSRLPSWTPSSQVPHTSTLGDQNPASAGKRQKISHVPDSTEAFFAPALDPMQELFSHWSSSTVPGVMFGHIDEPWTTSLCSQAQHAQPQQASTVESVFQSAATDRLSSDASKKRHASDEVASSMPHAKKAKRSLVEQAPAALSTPLQNTQQFCFSDSTQDPSYTYTAPSPPTPLPELNPLSHFQTLPAELRAAIYSHLGLTTMMVNRGVSCLGSVRKAHAEVHNATAKSWREHKKRYSNPEAGSEAYRIMIDEWKKQPAHENDGTAAVFATECKHHFRTGNAMPGVVTYSNEEEDPIDVDIKSAMALSATSKFFRDDINKIIFEKAPLLSVRIPDLDNGLDDDTAMMDAFLGKLPWKRFPKSTNLTISFEEAHLYGIDWDKRTRLSKDKSLALPDEIKTVIDCLKNKFTPKDLFIVLPLLRETERLPFTSPAQQTWLNVKIERAAKGLAAQIADWGAEVVNIGSLDSGFYSEFANKTKHKEMVECFEKVLRMWCGKGQGDTSEIMDISGPAVYDI